MPKINDCPSEPQKFREVPLPESLGQVYQEISALNDLAKDLERYLSPILTTDTSPEKGVIPNQVNSASTPVHGMLAEITLSIAILRSTLHGLISRQTITNF